MNNFFITKEPYVKVNTSFLSKIGNATLQKLGLRYTLHHHLDITNDMSSVEQRINYFLLLDSVIANNIPGDVVELGCFTGQCALLFQKVIEQNGSSKALHLYDSFQTKFAFDGDVQQELTDSFKKEGLTQPILHKGYFETTLPSQLPDQICFVHIDCGFGGDPEVHKEILLHCFTSIYEKLTKGAVCMLMDYHDEQTGDKGLDVNPGVKLACDLFFEDKPEKIIALYGNEYSHAFFRKV